MSEVSTTRLDLKFVHTVSKLTKNHGIDCVIAFKNIPKRLPELLANEAKIIVAENTDISVLSSKFIKRILLVPSNRLLFVYAIIRFPKTYCASHSVFFRFVCWIRSNID